MNSKTTYFSKISNHLFIYLVIFSVCFVWVNYYSHNMAKSIIIASMIAIAFATIYIPIRLNISKKQKNKNIETANKENIRNQFIYGNLDYNISYLLSLYNIDANKISANHYMGKDSSDIIFLLDENSDIDSNIKYCNSNNITIFTISGTTSFIHTNKEINIVEYNDIYQKIVSLSTPPIIMIKSKKSRKYSVKDLLCIIFNKDNSHHYLKAGIITLILSLFTLYPIYYITIGTLLIVLSIISRFYKSHTSTQLK